MHATEEHFGKTQGVGIEVQGLGRKRAAGGLIAAIVAVGGLGTEIVALGGHRDLIENPPVLGAVGSLGAGIDAFDAHSPGAEIGGPGAGIGAVDARRARHHLRCRSL